MKKLRKELKKYPLIQSMASIKITVACLGLLLLLTLWGTIAQVDNGLFAAQKRFFFSWYFLVFHFIPFPGARLVLWVFFINLVCVGLTRFHYHINSLGIMIIHGGLLLYFFAAFVTFHVTVESNITFFEGEGTNLSTSYREWELSAWEDQHEGQRKVTAVDMDNVHDGETLPMFQVKVKNYYPNSHAVVAPFLASQNHIVNGSGIASLEQIAEEKEPEKNVPGGIFEITSGDQPITFLLYGGESEPTRIPVGDKVYNVQLRHKRYELPFTITLKKFEREFHPNTEIAKSFKSLVNVDHLGLSREIQIYMNHPLRFQDYTLYQASYSIDQMGRQASTLAVVKNAGRLLPYIASLMTFAGMVVQFLFMPFIKGRRKYE